MFTHRPNRLFVSAPAKINMKPSVLNIVLVVLVSLQMMGLQFSIHSLKGDITSGLIGSMGSLIPTLLVVRIFKISK